MATELELMLFEEELSAVRGLPEASRWQLERGTTAPLELFAVMHPKSAPTELYKARFRWTDYFDAFSLKFIDMETGAENNPAAWPQCFGFRPASFDICLPWTAEGQKLHPEWKNSITQSFPKIELPMQHALLQLQFSLDSSYTGRARR